METIESMLGKCTLDRQPQIIFYIEGDCNDSYDIGDFKKLCLTPENLIFIRVVLDILNHDFVSEHWEKENPFSKYGIKVSYDDDDEYEEDDEESKDGNAPDSADENPLEKMKLQIMYTFLDRYLPSDPGWGDKCHTVNDLQVFISTKDYFGQLTDGNVTEEDIIAAYNYLEKIEE